MDSYESNRGNLFTDRQEAQLSVKDELNPAEVYRIMNSDSDSLTTTVAIWTFWRACPGQPQKYPAFS